MPAAGELGSPENPYDVLVIGAGPVGLSFASGLTHRGATRIAVVEQARAFRTIGQFINIQPNGVTALRLLNPTIKDCLRPYFWTKKPGEKTSFRNVNVAGEEIACDDTIALQDTSEDEFAVVHWSKLQHHLLSTLPNQGQDIIKLNYRLIDLVQMENMVRAQFAEASERPNQFQNWDLDDGKDATAKTADEMAKKSTAEAQREAEKIDRVDMELCARVVVAADGINSMARRTVYRDAGDWEKYADARYMGLVRVSAKGVPDVPDDLANALKKQYLGDSSSVTITCTEDRVSSESMRAIMVHDPTSRMWYTWMLTIYIRVSEEQALHTSRERLIELAQEEVRRAGGSEELVQLSSLLWKTQIADRLSVRPMYVVPATHPPPFDALSSTCDVEYPSGFDRPWSFGRVALIGDAAHGAPPFIAQGTSMGFEDACELCELLFRADVWSPSVETTVPCDTDMLDRIFAAYKRSRVERLCRMQRRSVNRASEYDRELIVGDRPYFHNFRPSAKVE